MQIHGSARMLFAAAAILWACDTAGERGPRKAPDQVEVVTRSAKDGPVLRMHFLASLSAALEPCGCRAGMLGGLDHLAAIVKPSSEPPSLLFAAGATLFPTSSLDPRKRKQDLLKAQTIARSLADLGLTAWTPGLSDFAAGTAELDELAKLLRAPMLAASVYATRPQNVTSRVLQHEGLSIGLAGVVLAAPDDELPAGVQISDATQAAQRALQELIRKRSELEILLVSGPRQAALSLIERVPGFEIALIGETYPRDEASDRGYPATSIGETRVLSPPGHLQAVSVVDVRRRDGRVDLAAPSEIEVREELGAAAEITARIADYHAQVDRMNRDASAAPPVHSGEAYYVGVEQCAGCHDAAFTFWNNTGHARAYWTLATRHREHDLDCVGCHVTGHDEPGGSSGTQPGVLQAVQCESCHGPGSRYAKSGTRDSIVRRPEPSLCRSCHKPPHVLPNWSLDAAWRSTVGVGHGAR